MRNEDEAQHRTENSENLDIALSPLRYKDKSRFLWVDRICIDQKNDEEKSSQIAKMVKIYQGAMRVCISLGRENDSSGFVRAFVKRLVKLDITDEMFDNIDEIKPRTAFSALDSPRNCLCQESHGLCWKIEDQMARLLRHGHVMGEAK
jgi:hypothetical protein